MLPLDFESGSFLTTLSFRDAVLEGDAGTEGNSASQSEVERPPNTLEMSVHDVEAMVDSMLRDSPLPDPLRASEEITEDGGSGKLPKGGCWCSLSTHFVIQLGEVLVNSSG